MRLRGLGFVVALAVAAAAGWWARGQVSPPPSSAIGAVPGATQRAVVTRIVDGDSLWVRVDEPGALPAADRHRVRLLEIDAPESQHPQLGNECGADAATAALSALVPVGSPVDLVADVEDLDRYGRALRYVYSEDGTFVNEALVAAGHARAVLFEPNDAHIERLRAAEAAARAARRGIWGEPCEAAA